jgi:hypothetical protein
LSCRFLPEDYDVVDAEKRLRVLEITFHNGVKGKVLVTTAPSLADDHFWHYDLSPDGKTISLTNQEGNSSVRVLDTDGRETAHEMIQGWPLLETSHTSDDRDQGRITWVSDDHSKPDRHIDCQGCKGIIIFNAEEILQHKANRTNTSTPCRFCGWHPAFPPEPWKPYP